MAANQGVAHAVPKAATRPSILLWRLPAKLCLPPPCQSATLPLPARMPCPQKDALAVNASACAAGLEIAQAGCEGMIEQLQAAKDANGRHLLANVWHAWGSGTQV